MGGLGSGTYYRWDVKDTTAGARRLDVRQLHRAGRLLPGGEYGWHWTDGGMVTIRVGATAVEGRALYLVLHYRSRCGGDTWEDVAEPVRLTWTPCRYGGWRPWFRCPAAVNGVACRRRVAILYGAGKYFACRHCYRLAYPSTRETPRDRALTKAQAIRMRLGGTANMLDPFPTKPGGMHWRTYGRLLREARRHEAAYDARIDAFLARYRELG